MPGKKKREAAAAAAAAARKAAGDLRHRAHEPVSSPGDPPCSDAAEEYGLALRRIGQHIEEERLRIVLNANSAMILLYWQIGRMILERQEKAGSAPKAIDRLSADLQAGNPDLRGFSSRNLHLMRKFADAWPNREIVQRLVSLLPWGHNVTLLDRLNDKARRLWYAEHTLKNGWSTETLVRQIAERAHERHGMALAKLPATTPPTDSEMAAQVFQDPFLFDFLGVADSRRQRADDQ